MESMIKIDGNPGDRTKDIEALAVAIVAIVKAGGDREVTMRALQVFESGTHVSNTISHCTFTNRTEKE